MWGKVRARRAAMEEMAAEALMVQTAVEAALEVADMTEPPQSLNAVEDVQTVAIEVQL